MSIVEDLLIILMFLLLIFRQFLLQQKLLEQKEYFIDTLSHDLRVSTIAQIRGLALLEKDFSFSDNTRELLEEIKSASNKSLDMINMLLNTYRFENKEQVLTPEDFNIKELISYSIDKMKNSLKEKNIAIDFNPTLPENVYADKNNIHKAFRILLSTAISYSIINSEIKINVKSNLKEIVVEIIYQGKFLSHEEQKRMFLKNPRFSIVGQGIQMHLCKKIIDFHKGKIYVESRNKQNSFTFILPKQKSYSSFETPYATVF